MGQLDTHAVVSPETLFVFLSCTDLYFARVANLHRGIEHEPEEPKAPGYFEISASLIGMPCGGKLFAEGAASAGLGYCDAQYV